MLKSLKTGLTSLLATTAISLFNPALASESIKQIPANQSASQSVEQVPSSQPVSYKLQEAEKRIQEAEKGLQEAQERYKISTRNLQHTAIRHEVIAKVNADDMKYPTWKNKWGSWEDIWTTIGEAIKENREYLIKLDKIRQSKDMDLVLLIALPQKLAEQQRNLYTTTERYTTTALAIKSRESKPYLAILTDGNENGIRDLFFDEDYLDKKLPGKSEEITVKYGKSDGSFESAQHFSEAAWYKLLSNNLE